LLVETLLPFDKIALKLTRKNGHLSF
jgi:hypothetical protein